jgi:hypothetical protein
MAMNASIPQARQHLPVWRSAVVWLTAFLSPTVSFVLLLLAGRLQLNVPEAFVGSLFVLVPVAALVICEVVVWKCTKTLGSRIGWMLFTLLALLLQFAVILAILRTMIVMAIGYASIESYEVSS